MDFSKLFHPKWLEVQSALRAGTQCGTNRHTSTHFNLI